jgi:hypothetical protein
MNGATRRLRTAAGLAVAGLAATLAMAACGNPAGDSASSGRAEGVSGGAADQAAPAAQPPVENKVGADAEKAGQAEGGAPTRFRVNERAIVYTGAMTVRVDDVDRAAARATEIATGAGGFVGSDKRSVDAARSEAALELRVPADRFQGVVAELAKLGDEESRGLSSEDVTEAVVDVDARVATQQASVNRTRALLAQAKTIAEIVSVEAELARREAELASLQARKRELADLSSLSTITVTLLGPDAKVDDDPGDDTGFLAGLRAGWRAFVTSVEVLLTVLGALLPWLIALGLPIWALVWFARRYGRRNPPRPFGPPPAAVTIPATPPARPPAGPAPAAANIPATPPARPPAGPPPPPTSPTS